MFCGGYQGNELMRAGLNALLCTSRQNYRQTGVSRYIDRLIAGLARVDQTVELLAYIDRGVQPDEWLRVRLRNPLIPVRHPALRIGWEMAALPIAIRRDRLDVFHGTVNSLPVGLAAATAVTVHDLAFLQYPEQVTNKRYHYLKFMIQSAVARADVVLVPSEATRADVVHRFSAQPESVIVTPLGVDSRFRPATVEVVASVRTKYGLDRPYILAVGTIEPRKNLPMLVRAFAAVQDAVPHDLVLAGPAGWLMNDLERTIAESGVENRVQRIGFVDDAALTGLYSGADAVVIPSLYEGFGLPVLEAMACGAPVVTSNVSSMLEVAGNAAVLVDPTRLESIVDGLRDVLLSAEVQTRLRVAGPVRAAEFTWDRTAQLTLSAYRSIAS